jgi:hypothetical protein
VRPDVLDGEGIGVRFADLSKQYADTEPRPDREVSRSTGDGPEIQARVVRCLKKALQSAADTLSVFWGKPLSSAVKPALEPDGGQVSSSS